MINNTFIATDDTLCIYKSIKQNRYKVRIKLVNKLDKDINYRLIVISKNGIEQNIIDQVLAGSEQYTSYRINTITNDTDVYIVSYETGLHVTSWEPLIL